MIDPSIIMRGAEQAQLQQQQNMESLGNLGSALGQMIYGRRVNQMQQLKKPEEQQAFANNSIYAPYLNAQLKEDNAVQLKAQQASEDRVYELEKRSINRGKAASSAIASILNGNPNPKAASFALHHLKAIGMLNEDEFNQTQQFLLDNTNNPDAIKGLANSLAAIGAEKPEQYITPTADNANTNATSIKNNQLDNKISAENSQRTLEGVKYGADSTAATKKAELAQELTIEKARVKAQQEGGSVQVFGGKAYFIDKKGNATPISHDTQGQPISALKSGVGALPTPALKIVTETQEGVDSADLAITKLDKLLANVDKANLGVWNNLESKGRNLIGNSNEQSQAYERVTSGLKDAANAILMAAKGVQTDGDAARAERIVMASNSSDPNVVKNAINDLKEFSEEIKLRQQNKIGGVYANYGLDPNDYFNGQNNSKNPNNGGMGKQQGSPPKKLPSTPSSGGQNAVSAASSKWGI